MKGYGKKHLASKAFLTIPMVLAFVGGIQAQAEELVTTESSQPEVSLTQSSIAEVKGALETNALTTASSESQATVSTQQESSETSTEIFSNVSSEVTSSTASSETASLTSASQTSRLSSETSSVSSTPVTASSENAVSSLSATASTTSLTSESPAIALVQGYAADVTNLPVTSVAQKDQALTIQYNRPISSDEVIKIAVWSDLKGQDDLKWYTADKLGAAYVELKNHRDYGKYNIHTYADRSGRMVGLNATELTVVAPAKPAITVSSKSVSVFDVTISNVPSTISSVKVPVWTNQNGQDDLVWYTANKQASGTYRVTVDTKNHKSETGQYHIHAYGQASGSLQLQGLTTATYTVTPSQADTVKQPSVSVVAKGETAFVATITNVPSTISSVKVPVWTNQNGQDDLVWYTASKQASGTYQVTVDTKNHKSETGQYHVHFYGQEIGRSQLVGLAASTYTVPTPKPKETMATTSTVKVSTSDYQKENGKVTVVVDAGTEASSVKLVRVAAWSESNQSNLKWYTATESKNGQVQITVDTVNHKYIDGNYTIHTYIDYQDGSTKGFNLGQYNLQVPKAKVQVSTTYKGTGVYGVTINHVVTKGEVVFAVWSEKNGQDDLKWYGAKAVSPTTYEATFDSKQYADAGNYMIHVYQKLDGKMQFLASSTQYVERNRYEMPVYSQRDGRWGGLQYGLFNLATAGCVPTALSMVFSSLTNQDIKPTTVANYLYHQTNHFNKYFIGTSSLGIFEASKNWGLNTTVLNSQSALEDALKEGHYVVAAVQYNKFVATGSHEIVLKGYQNGQTLVSDPYTGKTEWYPVSRIFSEASTDKDDTAHKGKPFIKITD